jgi:N-carbamoylputrescine amidase
VRVTVCELPHEPAALAEAWRGLCEHTSHRASELVLLPEFAMLEPVWEEPAFDPERWDAVACASEGWLQRLGELRAEHVVGTRPVTSDGRRYNQGYIWSEQAGVVALRSKHFMPNEAGGWERNWFDRGTADFPDFQAGTASFGLNICSELWALEAYGDYATRNIQMILAPRATAAATTAKWLSIGTVAAVRSGAFSLSSNRVDRAGRYGGAGWIISPDGRLVARTTVGIPFATSDIDLAVPHAARATYPRSLFLVAASGA